jgi:hypothetical protein
MARLRRVDWRFTADNIAEARATVDTTIELIELSVEEQADRAMNSLRHIALDPEDSHLMMLDTMDFNEKHGSEHFWYYTCFGIMYDAYCILHCPVREVREFSARSREEYYAWWHTIGKYDTERMRSIRIKH